MTILLQEEFDDRSSAGINSLERIYQGKSVKGGPVFSANNIQAANSYCQQFSRKQNGAICIIVKDKFFLRIWSEVATDGAAISQETKSLEAETSVDSMPVQPNFVTFCRQLLANEIGPIAGTVCNKTLAKNPSLTRTEFVTILAKKIADPTQAQKFRQAALD